MGLSNDQKNLPGVLFPILSTFVWFQNYLHVIKKNDFLKAT